MKSIIIIIPFFGTLPNSFKFWYQSALNNPTINFLLFTDCCISNAKNIKVIECSFNKFIQDIQSKFDFKINISAPYKLCDFRRRLRERTVCRYVYDMGRSQQRMVGRRRY